MSKDVVPSDLNIKPVISHSLEENETFLFEEVNKGNLGGVDRRTELTLRKRMLKVSLKCGYCKQIMISVVQHSHSVAEIKPLPI